MPVENTGENRSNSEHRAAVIPFLEALEYNAAFHYNRGKPLPPPIVSKATFWKALGRQITANLWGTALLLLACGFCGRIVTNGYTDLRDYLAAQPQVVEVPEKLMDGTIIMVQREVPSAQRLPTDWEEATLLKYERFVLLVGVCSYLGMAGLRRANMIETGVPVTSANTGHLPAVDSLVRASSKPAQSQANVLLRGAVGRQEEHAAQLVRPSGQ